MTTRRVLIMVDGKRTIDELAVLLARETYVRRGEGAEAWVVRRDHLRAVDPADLVVTTHRSHASNDGSAVAARRKAHRNPS